MLLEATSDSIWFMSTPLCKWKHLKLLQMDWHLSYIALKNHIHTHTQSVFAQLQFLPVVLTPLILFQVTQMDQQHINKT